MRPGDLVVFVVREDTSYQSTYLAGTLGLVTKSDAQLGLVRVFDQDGKIKAWRHVDWRVIQVSER